MKKMALDRPCSDCGASLNHLHKNRRRCDACKTSRKSGAHPTLPCPQCGREFIRGRRDQIYCCTRCQQRSYRAGKAAHRSTGAAPAERREKFSENTSPSAGHLRHSARDIPPDGPKTGCDTFFGAQS